LNIQKDSHWEFSLKMFILVGYNLIIEYEHPLSDRFLIGFKLYNQPFTNIDLVTGGFVKFGIMII